jgi:glutaminase
MTDLQALIDQIYTEVQRETKDQIHSGRILLDGADPNAFAVACVTIDGQMIMAGDHQTHFPLQSMSKAFTYGVALEDHGRDYLLTRVGVEPTGRRYNAIVLNEETGRPHNPMVNAGAIAIADIIDGDDLTHKLNRIIDKLSRYAGRKLLVDAPTFTYEYQNEHRNRAIAHLMRASNMIRGNIDEALHLYYQHCSLLVNAAELAAMAASLANRGVQPITGARALEQTYVRDVLSVMYTCGMYDSSGEWAYRVGLPAKSGISGGIFAVVPGRIGIGVWSPPLNATGHSIRGVRFFERLSDALLLHTFNCAPDEPGPATGPAPAPVTPAEN